MGTMNGIHSEQLHLKEDPGTEGHDSKPYEQETILHASPDNASDKLERKQSLDMKKIVSLPGKLKGASLNADADVSLKDHDIQTFNEERPTIKQKQSSEGGNHESQLDQVHKLLKNDTGEMEQDTGQHSLEACEEATPRSGSCKKQPNQTSTVVKQEANGSKSTQIPQTVDNASRFNQVPLMPKKESDLLEHSPVPDEGIHAPAYSLKQQVEGEIGVSQFNQVCIMSSKEKDDSGKKQHLDVALGPYAGQSMDTCVSGSMPDQEIVPQSARHDKTLYKLQPRRNLDSGGHPLRSTPDVSSVTTGRASDDGYNWRKYGQKFVKGNVFIRSYYKCTYSNCQAKKQVERSHDGPLTDIKYIGTHEHPKPYNPQLPAYVSPHQVTVADLSVTSKLKAEDDAVVPMDISRPVEPPLTPRQGSAIPNVVPEGCIDSQLQNLQHGNDSGGSPNLKKQKRETPCEDENMVRKTYCESRHVVQTRSEVDLINDGYRWRKYGQKLVKGNPNPRSYYRCTNAGCGAKKHVERASHDSKVVITTYEGKHDHDLPASRNINQSASESGVNYTTMSKESRSQLGEHKPVKIEKVVEIGIQTD